MSTVKVKLSPWFRRLIYFTLLLSWLTGTVFFALNTWVTTEGDFGPEKHPLQFTVLATHGAAAFMMLMLFGSMFSNHIPMSWRTKRLRNIGITLTCFVVTQIVTAYLLYYLADEQSRNVISYVHLCVGLSLPILLITHIIMGRRKQTSVKKK